MFYFAKLSTIGASLYAYASRDGTATRFERYEVMENAKLDFQREIEAGMAYAREALCSPERESNRDARHIAALAFAALASLASTNLRSGVESEIFDKPRVINFERARVKLSGVPRVRVKVGRNVGGERPRLRVYRGEAK